LFREIRRPVRTADLALVIAAGVEADALLADAGFDAAVCPEPRALGGGAGAGEGLRALILRCPAAPGRPGAGATASVGLGAGGLVLRAGDGEPEVAVSRLGLLPAHLQVSGLGALLSGDGAGGALVEVLADADGVVAYRLGRVTHQDFRLHFSGRDPPLGDAVLLDGEWWALARPAVPAPARPPPEGLSFAWGDLTAAAVGDVTGDGVPDLAASYRHPFRPSALSEARPGIVGVDSLGRSAHLGVFTLRGEPLWAAGYIPRPVGALAACDGAVALAYTGIDGPAVVAAGAGVWRQAFAEGDAPLPPAPPRHWVEPDPVPFERLAEAARLLRAGLAERGLLTDETGVLLGDLVAMEGRFGRIARDELAGRPISAADNDWLAEIGSQFELLWLQAGDAEVE
jgi:hypothetical protein